MQSLQTAEHSNAKNLLSSISSELNIIEPQFYFPGFNIVSNDEYITQNTVLESKYKVMTVLYQIDKIVDKYGDINSDLDSTDNNTNIVNTPNIINTVNTPSNDILLQNSNICCDATNCIPIDVENSKNTDFIENTVNTNVNDDVNTNESDEWTDCSSSETNNSQETDSESVISEYDLLANNTLDLPTEDCTLEQLDHKKMIDEQTKFFEQLREADKLDNTDNCFNLMAILQKNQGNLVKTYHQKIFCKRAPLIEPLKAIDTNVYPDLFQLMKKGTITNNLLPDPNTKQIFDKLNSIHNTSHVETFALYALGKLTECGKCPTFPYYFGSVQGLTPVYYHNITDEIQDYSGYAWFVELLENEKIQVLYIDISAYANSGLEILRSEDMNISFEKNDYPTQDEINKNTQTIDNIITDFETLMDDTNVEEFISTGKLLDNDDALKPKNDLAKSKLSNKSIEFENLADIDIDNLKIDDILPEKKFNNKLFYLKLTNYPISLNFMESMNGSLDDMMNSPKSMTQTELLSILFQVSFGLAVANKEYRFVHNDLHAGNIMFQNTPQKYLYYYIHGNYYRIPSYNKIAKIIDFARATMYINNKWVVSDAFEPDNDAGEQYAMPNPDGKYDTPSFNENGQKLPKPNPSFDLALLSTILVPYVINNIPNSTELLNMLNGWATDKYGTNHVHSDVEFSLYINLARDCHNAIPREILKNHIFQQFKISPKKIPKKQFVYKF